MEYPKLTRYPLTHKVAVELYGDTRLTLSRNAGDYDETLVCGNARWDDENSETRFEFLSKNIDLASDDELIAAARRAQTQFDAA